MPEPVPSIMSDAIQDFMHADADLRKAVRAERDYEFRRPVEKLAAIRSLLGTMNPITGKEHSATSAEQACETVPAYAAFRREQTDAVVHRMVAEEAHHIAKARLDYAARRAASLQETIGT
jgi:head-tail adaptor